jgi:hypothetical protein
LFLSGNVVSVETAGTGAPAVTIIEVADERQLQETIDAAEALVGKAEVRVAETVLEGVDTQVILGMSYLEHELARGANAPAPDDSPGNTSPDATVVESTSPSTTDRTGTVPGDG